MLVWPAAWFKAPGLRLKAGSARQLAGLASFVTLQVCVCVCVCVCMSARARV